MPGLHKEYDPENEITSVKILYHHRMDMVDKFLVIYLMKESSMKSIFNTARLLPGLADKELEFYYHNERVYEQDTLALLGMEDGDSLDVLVAEDN